MPHDDAFLRVLCHRAGTGVVAAGDRVSSVGAAGGQQKLRQ